MIERMKTKTLFTSLGLILILIALSTVAIRYLTRSETLSEYAASQEAVSSESSAADDGQSAADSASPKDSTSPDTAVNANVAEAPETDTSVNYEDTDSFFTISPLSEEMKERITGVSYPADATDLAISYDELRYLTVLYTNFEGETAVGELICNEAIADDLIAIFRELYENKYPIERIRLIDDYGADDEASMRDNNTSCFNYRTVVGTSYLSNHALGLAIDINPLYNPYILSGGNTDGNDYIAPQGAEQYVDRSLSFAHKIDQSDLCYRLFVTRGFTWGGSWSGNVRDYQHFEKNL